MKTIRILILIIISTVTISCSKDYLEEKPVSFLSSNNAYKTYADINSSVNNLYYLVRYEFFSLDEMRPFDYIFGTDLVYDGEPSVERYTNMLAAFDPTSYRNFIHWNNLYKIISESNTIINKSATAQITDQQRTLVIAQAKFFRAFSYRTLVYLYGGVPLVVDEVTTPKIDFVRASKEEVLNQIIEDLKFAAVNLPGITQVKNGEVNNLCAQHLLAEVYLAANKPKEAIAAATVVIDDPATDLMRNRFGSRANEAGDVYWDLFRKNNQNRASGNKEGIWVIQFETDVLGGGSLSSEKGGSFLMERLHAPMFRDLQIAGKNPFKWPFDNNGTGGRGIGWAISTKYFSDGIWTGADFNDDMRNSDYNFVRKFTVNNPGVPGYPVGSVINTQSPPPGVVVPSRQIYAYQSKATTPNNHPAGMYANKATGELTNAAGATYTDQYMFRLAETYLLRAEAYMKDGNNQKAADDINVVRLRAKASLVLSANVTMDYILDERMRELGVEEKRRLTLMRTGTIYDRVVKYNPYYANQILTKFNLWPIPSGDIERNTGAKLEQNPGY